MLNKDNAVMALDVMPTQPHVQVLDRVEGWLARVKADTSLAFTDDFKEIAREARAKDSVLWQRIENALHKRGFNWKRFLRELDQDAADEGGAIVAIPEGNALIPPGYTVKSGDLLRETREKSGDITHKLVAHELIAITKKLRDLDTGAESLEVIWGWGGQWTRRVMDRAVAFDGRKLVSQASFGFPAGGDNAGPVARYLLEYEAHNRNLPVELVSSHLGWQGTHGKYGFLAGKRLIDAEGNIHE